MSEWLQTYSSVAFDLEAPTPDMILLRDLGHSLAHQSRFTGHCRRPYSVADHCLRVARHVPPWLRAGALLHDAAESFVGDVATPLKRLLGEPYRAVERRVTEAISERFGVPVAHMKHPLVHEADLRMLATEAAAMLGPPPRDWGLPEWALPYDTEHIPRFAGPFYAWRMKRAYLNALECILIDNAPRHVAPLLEAA